MEVLDLDAATPPTWLSDLQGLLQFVWNSHSIACSPYELMRVDNPVFWPRNPYMYEVCA